MMLSGIRRLVLVGMVILAAVPFGSAAAPPSACLAVGDSLAAGVGSTLPRERSAAVLLCEWASTYLGEKSELVSLAVPGERTESFLSGGQAERLRQTVARLRAEGRAIRFVLISLGGNDVLQLRAADEVEREEQLAAFEANYAEAMRVIRSAVGDVPLLALTLYDPTEGDASAPRSDSWWIAQFDRAIRAGAESVGALVVDLDKEFRGRTDEWTWWPVDIHPTNAGYAAIARAAWRALAWDRQAPQVVIERPEAGSRVERRFLTVRARISDLGGIERVGLWVDGQEIGTLDPLPGADEWITLWETPWPLPGPPLRLEVRAVDRAGNEGRAAVELVRP
jgi:lysophospholipase L1-like esterase